MRAYPTRSPGWMPSSAVLEELERLRKRQAPEAPAMQLPIPEAPPQEPSVDIHPGRGGTVIVIDL